MKEYTFIFNGEVTVLAETENDARELAEELIAPTPYAYYHAEDISIYEVDLTDVEDIESEE